MTTARRTRRAGRLALTATAVAALLAAGACTTSGKEDPGLGPDPSTSSAPPTSASPSPTGSSESPSPSGSATPEGFSLEEQKSDDWPELGGNVGIGVEARVGKHTGYDRVVYEFSRKATPTYRVHWVDEPTDQGSGEVKDIAGDAWLEVVVTKVDIPGESAPSPDDPLPATLEGTGIAAAPAIWGGFEGYGQQFIGVEGEQRPFKVSVLKNPTRVVVDIAR